MIHDQSLLDAVDSFPRVAYDGVVFRATRQNLDPLTSSRSGGRWMSAGGAGVLYTSMESDGALAEISFHWSQWNPMPSKPALVHKLLVQANKTLRLIRADLKILGVSEDEYSGTNLPRTQEIGAAVEFLGCDGLIVPSARWTCDNLILFPDSADFAGSLEVVSSEKVDWVGWARDKKMLDPKS